MRDFYDIYVLTSTRKIDADIFRAALGKTAAKRKTADQMAEADITIERVATSGEMSNQWIRYQKKFSYAADITWEAAINALRKIATVNSE
jgi:hypothetical protein